MLRTLCARNVAVPLGLCPQGQSLRRLGPVLTPASYLCTTATARSPLDDEKSPSASSSDTSAHPAATWTPTSEVKKNTSVGSGAPADWTRTADVGADSEFRKCFLDSEQSFAHLSTTELMRANVVLQACGLAGPLVPYIDKMYSAAVSVTGPTLINEVMRPTAFAHFCGGEQAQDMLPKLKSLQHYGVGGILDYAAEAKEGEGGGSKEALYDAQIALFEEAIGVAAQGGSEHNLVAIKVSALCGVPLLIKASKGLAEAQRTFFRLAGAEAAAGQEDAWGVPFAASSDSTLDAAAIARGWAENGPEISSVGGSGHVDLVDWTAYWTPERITASLADCASSEPFPALSPEELALLARAEERIDTVCAHARKHGVRLLVDAEWSKSQPAMDYMALRAAAKHNVLTEENQYATVLQTYQCYLCGSLGRCERDLELAKRQGWAFGAKLVRGAYIVQERAEAEEAGRVSPIWDSLPLTEENYHSAIAASMTNHRQGDQVMVASHNTDSLLYAIRKMRELKLDPKESGILFAQLLGMAEAASFSLAKNGYRVFKYMPYGPLDDVVPYLLRRTQENSTLLGTPAVRMEREMLMEECVRRATGLDLGWAIRSK